MADDDRPGKRRRMEEGAAVSNPLAPVGWVTWNCRQNNFDLQSRQANGDNVYIPGSLSYEVNNTQIGDIVLLDHESWDDFADDGNELDVDLLATTILNRAGQRNMSHEEFVSQYSLIGFAVSATNNQEKGGNIDFAATCSGVISRVNDGDLAVRAGEFLYWENPFAPGVYATEEGKPIMDNANGLRGRDNDRYVPILRPLRRNSHLSAQSIFRILRRQEDIGGDAVFSSQWYKRFDRADIDDEYSDFARSNAQHIQAAADLSVFIKTSAIFTVTALDRIGAINWEKLDDVLEGKARAESGTVDEYSRNGNVDGDKKIDTLNSLLNFAEPDNDNVQITIGEGDAEQVMPFSSYLIAHYQQNYDLTRVLSRERSLSHNKQLIRDSAYNALDYLIRSCAAARAFVSRRTCAQAMNNSDPGERLDLNIIQIQ